MLLATLGLYGVISYMVARRHTEIGVRIALGADRKHIIGLVFRESVWLLAFGLVLGGALWIPLSRYAGSLLFGLKPNDPVTIAASVGLLAMTTLLASFIPAARAARLDPAVTIRDE